MFKKLWLITVGITIANGFLTYAGAAQLTTEFYPASNIPKEYQKMADGGDFTVIKLEDWPWSDSISVFEKRLTAPGIKRCNSLRPKAGMTPVQIVSSLGYTPGDPVTFTFKDSKALQEISCVPNRLLAKSQVDGATVEAIIDCLFPAHYEIELKGFSKNEEILFKSRSCDEVMERKITVGTYLEMGYMPAVIGQEGGIATISFTRSSGEILSLELPWGLEWVKYQLYADNEGKIKSVVNDKEFLKKNPEIYKYFETKTKK